MTEVSIWLIGQMTINTNAKIMTLQQLINQAQQTLSEIRKHPEYQQIANDYSPDLTLGDAATALTYLQWELSDRGIQVSKLEAFAE